MKLVACLVIFAWVAAAEGTTLLVDAGRADAPEARIKEHPGAKIAIDGRLDEPAWRDAQEFGLRDLANGKTPTATTGFRAFWADGALYLAVRVNSLQKPVVGATKHDDQAIWNGDVVELLLETQSHGYYQLAVNSAGVLVDIDRKKGIEPAWESGAQVAAQTDGTGWTVEMRIPFAGDTQTSIDLPKGVAGSRPNPRSPWYFNVCRQTIGANGTEYSAFSPTGKTDFHVPEKFGKMYVR